MEVAQKWQCPDPTRIDQFETLKLNLLKIILIFISPSQKWNEVPSYQWKMYMYFCEIKFWDGVQHRLRGYKCQCRWVTGSYIVAKQYRTFGPLPIEFVEIGPRRTNWIYASIFILKMFDLENGVRVVNDKTASVFSKCSKFGGLIISWW